MSLSRFFHNHSISPTVGIDGDTITKLIETRIARALIRRPETMDTDSRMMPVRAAKRTSCGSNENVITRFDPETSEITTD